MEGLSLAMRHLMPVVPDPVHDSIIAVQVAWNRLPRVRVQRGERCLKRIPLRKILADTASGRILNGNAQVACLVYELGEHLDRTNEMEEELLNELLAVLGIGSKEIPTVQCKEFFLPPTGEAEPLANVFGSQGWVSHRAERRITSAERSARRRTRAPARAGTRRAPGLSSRAAS